LRGVCSSRKTFRIDVGFRSFSPCERGSICDEIARGARDSAARIAIVEAALLRLLGAGLDATVIRTASILRADPGISMEQLASELGIRCRHPSRAFRGTFGLKLKKFARLSRLETIIARQNVGLAWAEIACDAKMSNQAHLVKEFKNIVGETPEQFFGRDRGPDMGATSGASFIVQRR
jgi:AraC-like DNA-binding protein